jgi:ABC-type bacteriocin/lantibiotic exporter with double-glycine peptidase domain
VNAALILGIGGSRVIDGHISLGGLVAFQILTATFTGPVNRLVALAQRLQLAEGEVGLLDDMLRVPPALQSCPPRETSAGKLSGRLELRNVTFGYSPMDPPVLTGIDLELASGACIAVTGKTGSGKSTLGKLVSGLYQPWQGLILFDGRQRSDTPRDVWLNSVAAVDQDIIVFEGTVRENLTFSNQGVPEERLLAAIQDACIADEIFARPGGLDAWIAEGGVNWSGGQLQRLEIARALARDPALVILDEATSALDPRIEARIVRNLRRRGCACLMIAHRLSTIRDANEIIVLEDGTVTQRGRHDDLIASRGQYTSLVTNE